MRNRILFFFGLKVKPAYVRFIYRYLTNDESAAHDAQEASINKRVEMLLQFGDPDIVVDFRDQNPGRPPKYQKFWDETNTYIHNVAELASVQERRHESISYMASALSVRALRDNVAKRLPEGSPVPSLATIRLQFWPRNPTAKAAESFTGKIAVKYMVQQRQLRATHEDEHYAAALFRYLRQMAVDYREDANLLCVDDKHKVKVGNPGHPVAAVERGKPVLVGVNKTFAVSDHDFTNLTLTPSVILQVDIPSCIEESFYRGRVFVGIKDSAFQASRPMRHAAEMTQVLSEQESKPILLLYSDGGPDHRVNYSSVQRSLVSMFLKLDLDALYAVRTPPGHSWRNPAERMMSIINIGLQSVGVMREKLENEALEKQVLRCNSVNSVRNLATKQPDVRTQLTDSLQQPITLLTSIMQQLKLGEEAFSTFTPASDRSIQTHEDAVKELDSSFFAQHCQLRTYSFCVKKCTDSDCKAHKPPKLDEETFKGLHFLPDPTPDPENPDHYLAFDKIYGQETTECHKPSLKRKEREGHGLSFNPSAQTVSRVKRLVWCIECDKPRVLHAEKKLTHEKLLNLDNCLEAVEFSCGSVMSDHIPNDSSEEHILSKVFVRKDINCLNPIEIPYYSSGIFPLICTNCAGDTEFVKGAQADAYYPICTGCWDSNGKVLKRKRKLFKEK